MEQPRRMKKVLCPVTNEKTQRTHWLRVGAAYTNRDGSTNVYLDAYPTHGKLQIRDLDDRDRERMASGRGTRAEGGDEEDGDLPF